MEINRRHLGIICLCILGIILIAGLWPRTFNNKNDAILLPDAKGIRFSGRGIIYTRSSLKYPSPTSIPGALTIELAVQPNKEFGSSLPIILAINDEKPCERLLIGQWKKHLIIRSRRTSCFQSGYYGEIDIENALPKGKEQFITIASGKDGTILYVNGTSVKRYRNFSILKPGEVLSGRLILGNSSTGNHSWEGSISALAIHDRFLSSDEILRHYEAWRDHGSLSLEENKLPISLYRFIERTGSVIKDHSGQGNDLIIPERLTPLRREMLTPPWRDFQATLRYARDVAINILGFIPFGFYVTWYLSVKGVTRLSVVIMVLVLGIGTSLSIEIIQAYLPERTSQMVDVITNVSGTAIGIYLCYFYILLRRTTHSKQ